MSTGDWSSSTRPTRSSAGRARRPRSPCSASEPRLVVTRTMSKAFAFAGTRVGYCAASTEIVDALRLVRLPYHLSAVTQIVARTAIAHAEELLAQVDVLREERDGLVDWLRGQGFDGRRQRRQLRVLRPLRRPRRACGRRCSSAGRADPGDRSGRLAAGQRRHPAEMAAFRDALTGVTARSRTDARRRGGDEWPSVRPHRRHGADRAAELSKLT